MPVCWFNGNIMDASEAKISVFDHGLLYGDGVFEGLRFYQGKVFRLLSHLERFEKSARAIMLPLPFDHKTLAMAVEETIKASNQSEGYIRMVATRGEGPLGINPATCTQGCLFMIADQLQMSNARILSDGARLMIAATRRLGPDGLDPKIKSLNYLNNIMAKIEANQAGYDEAILLNQMGNVAEGTVDNVFVVADGVLKTPPVSDGALDGITRTVVLELAEKLEIPCQEKSLTAYDLFLADECFLTGTGAELIPVREISGREMTSAERPIFNRIQNAFSEVVTEESSQQALNWC
ncbi:MAG: branched-chain-amino-acid transaminase [SAR324 cluster bacterium]|nr:branched-chain-amino-acid transaminase [SAR324 cluster bacterium]